MSFAGLQLDTKAGVLEGSDAGAVITPGKPEESTLFNALLYDSATKMPPTGKLSVEVLADFRSWILQGALWPDEGVTAIVKAIAKKAAREHWAWKPVIKVAPPQVKDAAWVLDDLDRFILAKLEEKALRPAGDATREIWLRRVALDLTGLQPSVEEQDEFLREGSYEKVVDRLLASNAFGQRWGRHWLDQTSYADNIGIRRRIPARHAWRYLDYVMMSQPMSRSQVPKSEVPVDRKPPRSMLKSKAVF